MNKILKTGLIAGLLIAVLALLSGCVAGTTTNAAGEVEQPSFWAQYGMIFFLVAIFAIFYFVMIRPQRKRQKEQQAMIANLQKGDKVMTIGGIFGTIDNIGENSLLLKLEGGQVIRVARNAVNPIKDDSVMK